jgi:hypothetical protein
MKMLLHLWMIAIAAWAGGVAAARDAELLDPEAAPFLGTIGRLRDH